MSESTVTCTPARELTGRQNGLTAIMRSIARDMRNNGTPAEQGTSALLLVVAEIIEAGREAEAHALLRAWRLERESEGHGG